MTPARLPKSLAMFIRARHAANACHEHKSACRASVTIVFASNDVATVACFFICCNLLPTACDSILALRRSIAMMWSHSRAARAPPLSFVHVPFFWHVWDCLRTVSHGCSECVLEESSAELSAAEPLPQHSSHVLGFIHWHARQQAVAWANAGQP